jgi:uncharacterized protein (TIGR02391 family)
MGHVAACFSPGELEALSREIGDALTGSDIGQYLAIARLSDNGAGITKWRRLAAAFFQAQFNDKNANKVLAFVRHAFDPSRYIGRRDEFLARTAGINKVLAFHGLKFEEDGKYHKISAATTLGDAERIADRLKHELKSRNVEDEVLLFCKAELLNKNYFHAVLEATKSLASLIRTKTGLTTDGAELIDNALGGASPILRINDFSDDSKISEQKGFVNLLKGLFGTFRNPTAHSPKVFWNMEEQDALDIFVLVSYAYRRIKKAK